MKLIHSFVLVICYVVFASPSYAKANIVVNDKVVCAYNSEANMKCWNSEIDQCAFVGLESSACQKQNEFSCMVDDFNQMVCGAGECVKGDDGYVLCSNFKSGKCAKHHSTGRAHCENNPVADLQITCSETENLNAYMCESKKPPIFTELDSNACEAEIDSVDIWCKLPDYNTSQCKKNLTTNEVRCVEAN